MTIFFWITWQLSFGDKNITLSHSIGHDNFLLVHKIITSLSIFKHDNILFLHKTITLSYIIVHRKKANTVTYGQRSFHHAAPELWNQLPSHVKNATSLQQFKSLLKAHLFSKWLCFCICILINMFVSFVKRTVVLWRSALNKRVFFLLLLLLYMKVSFGT